MRIWIRASATVLVVALLAFPTRAQAIDATDAWRALAMQVKPGTQLDVRLQNGQRFPAVLVATRDDGVVILPKARLAVPAQFVAYSEIVSLERRDGHGMSAGKAAAIGVGAGGAAFLGILLMLVATLD